MGNENTKTYQVVIIYHQILITNLQGNMSQLEGRINNQILGVKGLMWNIFYRNFFLRFNHF